jgi:hypothetical protein
MGLGLRLHKKVQLRGWGKAEESGMFLIWDLVGFLICYNA